MYLVLGVIASGSIITEDARLSGGAQPLGGVITTNTLHIDSGFLLDLGNTPVSFSRLRAITNSARVSAPAGIPLEITGHLIWGYEGMISGPGGARAIGATITAVGSIRGETPILDTSLYIDSNSVLDLTGGGGASLLMTDNARITLSGRINFGEVGGILLLHGAECPPPCLINVAGFAEIVPGNRVVSIPCRFETSTAFLRIPNGTLRLEAGGAFQFATVIILEDDATIELAPFLPFDPECSTYTIPGTTLFLYSKRPSNFVVLPGAVFAAVLGSSFFGQCEVRGDRLVRGIVGVGSESRFVNYGVINVLGGELVTTLADSTFLNLFGLNFRFDPVSGAAARIRGPGVIDNRGYMKIQTGSATLEDRPEQGVIRNHHELTIDPPSLGFIGPTFSTRARLEQHAEMFVTLRSGNELGLLPQSSVLHTTGAAVLAGALHILTAGFEPELLDTFGIITSFEREGFFETVTSGYRLFYRSPGQIPLPFPFLANVVVLRADAPPTLDVVTPGSGAVFPGGSIVPITWNASGASAAVQYVVIELFHVGPGGALTRQGEVGTALMADGVFPWTIPDCIGDGEYRIRLSEALLNVAEIAQPAEPVDDFSETFSITDSNPDPTPQLALLTPQRADVWQIGTNQMVEWSAPNPFGDVILTLFPLVQGLPEFRGPVAMAGGSLIWSVNPATTPGRYRLGIAGFGCEGFAVDFVDIQIDTAPGPTVMNTTGGQSWPAGSTQPITWTAADPTGNLYCELFRLEEGGGESFLGTIGGEDMAAESFSWDIPVCLGDGSYRVDLRLDSGKRIASDPFTITGSVPIPMVSFTSPSVGEQWRAGDMQTIEWDVTQPFGEIGLIARSTDGEVYAPIVADALMADGAVEWTIDPATRPGEYEITAFWASCGTTGVIAVSDPFEILAGSSCDPCDMNCDGSIDAFDIEPFLDLLFDPKATPCDTCTGDTNGDGSIDAFDIEPFLECLFG